MIVIVDLVLKRSSSRKQKNRIYYSALVLVVLQIHDYSTDRPLCVFDLETTGLDISKDRIVQIAILKIHPTVKRRTKPPNQSRNEYFRK